MSSPFTAWRRSSFSDHTDCIELAPSAVRDSKNLPGPILTFESPGITALVAAARSGALDLPG
jgi:hypothetical protein